MTVVQYEQPPPLPASQPGDELLPGPTGDVARLRAAAEYAGFIGDTEFVPETLRGRPAAIAAALLAGDELGLKKMVALRTIAIIRGRPTMTAEAQRGLVLGRGHELWFDESTTTRAIAAGRRAGSDRVGRVTWTLDDAKRAGIAGGEAWRRYPAEMLRARASAALARAMFADVTLGIPASEELEGEPDNGSLAAPPPEPPPDVTPPAPATRARRRPAASTPKPAAAAGPVAAPPPPDTQPEPDPPADPPITDAQKRHLFALLRDLGLDDDRETRIAYTTRAIGREIASWNDLTIGEASSLIEGLMAVAALPDPNARKRLLDPPVPGSEPGVPVDEALAREAALNAEVEQLKAEGVIEPESNDDESESAEDVPPAHDPYDIPY